MSQHKLPPHVAGREVLIGWDPPFGSFYVHVTDPTKDEDDVAYDLLWIGCSPGEIPAAEEAVEAVRPFARVPDGLVDLLGADARREGSR